MYQMITLIYYRHLLLERGLHTLHLYLCPSFLRSPNPLAFFKHIGSYASQHGSSAGDILKESNRHSLEDPDIQLFPYIYTGSSY